jgi:hypothetical protein
LHLVRYAWIASERRLSDEALETERQRVILEERKLALRFEAGRAILEAVAPVRLKGYQLRLEQLREELSGIELEGEMQRRTWADVVMGVTSTSAESTGSLPPIPDRVPRGRRALPGKAGLGRQHVGEPEPQDRLEVAAEHLRHPLFFFRVAEQRAGFPYRDEVRPSTPACRQAPRDHRLEFALAIGKDNRRNGKGCNHVCNHSASVDMRQPR